MNIDGQHLGEKEAARDIEKHNRVLLHALQTGHPMIYRGRQRFIHTLRYTRAGGGIETALYLAGDTEPVPCAEVTLDRNHFQIDLDPPPAATQHTEDQA